jgi:hypothetical protein
MPRPTAGWLPSWTPTRIRINGFAAPECAEFIIGHAFRVIRWLRPGDALCLMKGNS